MLRSQFRKWNVLAVLSTLVVLFLITACGGGGGGGNGGGGNNNGMNNALLSGKYREGIIAFRPKGRTDIADFTYDGSGNFICRTISNAISGTYSVQSDGVLTEEYISGENRTGQVSQDGAIFHTVHTTASDLWLSIAIKKSSGMSVADLNGTYQTFVFFMVDNYDFIVVRFSFDYDGGGLFTYTGITNPADTDNGSYTVDNTGIFTIDLGGEGQVSANGDIFFFAGPTYLAIGIRQSTGMSTADLVGTFHAIALTDDDATDNDAGTLSNGRGSIVADGAGNINITPIDPPDSPSTGTYTVNSDGTITNADPNSGQLSPDTGFFIMADDGTLDADDDYEMIIGILKP